MAQTKIINKKLIIFTFIFALLLVYFLVFEKKIEQKEAGKNNLFKYVIADITEFAIEKTDSVIEVERILNDWKIKKPADLPGSKTDIDSFLQDVRDIQKVRVVGKNMADLKPFGLDAPIVVYKVRAADQVLTLKLGDKNPDQSGYYAKFENQPELMVIEIGAEAVIDKELLHFRDKEIFRLDAEDIKECRITDNGKKYALEYEDHWKMKLPIEFDEPEEIDIKEIIGNIADISVKEFFDMNKKVSAVKAGLKSSRRVITLIDNKKKEYILNIGKETEEYSRYYAGLAKKNLIFAVDKYIYDDIISDLDKLVEEKKALDEELKKKEEEKKNDKDEEEEEK